jgi:hypothetical protein
MHVSHKRKILKYKAKKSSKRSHLNHHNKKTKKSLKNMRGGGGINKVYLFKNHKTKIEIGSIDDEKYKIIINKIPIESVNKFNLELLHFIMKVDNYGGLKTQNNANDFKNYFIETNSDISGIVINIITGRKYALFHVIQKSTIGIRYLCYIFAKINHSSDALGHFNIDSINFDEKHKDDYIKSVKDFEKYLLNLNTIHTLYDIIPNIETNFDECFGV